MIDTRRIIGRAIRRGRERAGWTVYDLAAAVGYTPEQVRRIEAGTSGSVMALDCCLSAVGLRLVVEEER